MNFSLSLKESWDLWGEFWKCHWELEPYLTCLGGTPPKPVSGSRNTHSQVLSSVVQPRKVKEKSQTQQKRTARHHIPQLWPRASGCRKRWWLHTSAEGFGPWMGRPCLQGHVTASRRSSSPPEFLREFQTPEIPWFSDYCAKTTTRGTKHWCFSMCLSIRSRLNASSFSWAHRYRRDWDRKQSPKWAPLARTPPSFLFSPNQRSTW